MDEEKDGFMALMGQRTAHARDMLEALEANVRVLQGLLVLLVRDASGMTLGEALQTGRIG